jgi:O-methyltransferase involved in polyketide biosynthesis
MRRPVSGDWPEGDGKRGHQIAVLAPGSTLAMTFLLPSDMVEDVLRPGFEAAEKGARAAGTPFVSFSTPDEMTASATQAGFRVAHHISAAALNERYFADRTDGLRTARGEELLVART